MGGSNEKVELNKAKEFKTINHNEKITDIIIMELGQMILSTEKGKLEVYLTNNYTLFTSSSFQRCRINTLCEVKKNLLAIGLDDNTIKIVNTQKRGELSTIQTLKDHQSPVIQIIFLTNEQICSLGLDNSIILYKRKLDKYVFNGRLKKGLFSYSAIYQANDEEIICSSTNDGVKFWSLTYMTKDYKIKGMKIEDFKDIYKIKNLLLNPGRKVFCNINKDIIAALGLECIYLISCENHNVKKKINYNENVYFSCIHVLKDKTILISENDAINFCSRCVIQYKCDENGDKWEKIGQKEFSNSSEIEFIVQNNDGVVLTANIFDIILWKGK